MKKKIGILVNDKLLVSKYLYETIEEIRSWDNVELIFLISPNASNKPNKLARLRDNIRTKGLLATLRTLLFFSYAKFEYKLFANKRDYIKEHYDLESIEGLSNSVVNLTPIYSKSKLFVEYPKDDINKIKKLKLDLILRGNAQGIFRKDILTASDFGVVSFHHGDNRWNRGGPPGFWEVYKKRESVGFIVQILNSELDGGEVIFRGSVQTQRSYIETVSLLYSQSNFFIAKVIYDLLFDYSKVKVEESVPCSDVLYLSPKVSHLLRYTSRLYFNLIINFIKIKLGFRTHWGVSFLKGDWKSGSLRKSKSIKNPVNGFYADPFVILKGGRNIIFVEEYCFKKNKGFISAIEIMGDGSYSILGKIIEEDFHMSYPCIFEFESKLYMVPETHQDRSIRIYECIDFPMGWKLHSIPFTNVDAADSTVFLKEGVWWLLTNISHNSSYHHSNLSAFYSTNPISGSWREHLTSPLIFDSEVGRNGGVLYSDNEVFRCRQRQGFDNYGESLSISRICVLSNSEFSEKLFCDIKPNFYENIKGSHHVTSNGNYTVFDYSKTERLNNG